MMPPSMERGSPVPRRARKGSSGRRRSSTDSVQSDPSLDRRDSNPKSPSQQLKCLGSAPQIHNKWEQHAHRKSVTYTHKKWDRDKMLNVDQKRYLQDFFHKEPCLYGHAVFSHASVLFGVLQHDLSEQNPVLKRRKAEEAKKQLAALPPLEYDSLSDQRASFHLTFSTLKYQQFLEDMLEDCAFFSQFPEYRGDRSLIMVILCDLKLRKFQLRVPLPGEVLVKHLSEIEAALNACKTKLNAALARSRIKACVLTVDHLLPESVRQNDKFASKMHVSAWVNFSRTTLQQTQDELEKLDFKQVQSGDKLKGRSYYIDHHCTDTLVFPGELREYLEAHTLVIKGHMVIQDKSSCVGPQSVRHLVNLGDDILQVNVGAGLTMAHLASLTHGSNSVIFGFGIKNDKHFDIVMATLERTGCKSRCRVIEETYLDISNDDERFKHIKVALMSADCSRSGVANPIDFIVSEGEGGIGHPRHMGILKDLSLGILDDERLAELAVLHTSSLRHSMKFPRVQAVVYCTRSVNDAENENVVTRAIEQCNTVNNKKTPFRLAPPVLPLTDKEIEKENPLVGKYLKFLPSSAMSGCFIATITREADDPKQAAKDILARAAARGIISGMPGTVDKLRRKKSASKPKDKPEKVNKEEKKDRVAKSAKAGRSSKVSEVSGRQVSSAVFGSLRAVTSLQRMSVVPMISPSMKRLTASPPAPHHSSTAHLPAHRLVVCHPTPFR